MKITTEQYEQICPVFSVTHENRTVLFYTPAQRVKWRINTIFTKEPDTMQWIAGFAPSDIFIDVGANIGLYSIWAAMTRGVRVYAFEPESQNYALLYKNIMLNNLGDTVVGYCVALSDEMKFSKLYLVKFSPGESSNTFDAAVDDNLKPVDKPYTQGCFSISLDELVETGVIPVPTHVKIDVDGFEHKVIAGAARTIENKAVKSILVEINPRIDEHRSIVDWLVSRGFSYSMEQVEQSARKIGNPLANHIFRR